MYDPEDLDQRFVVELLLDGHPAALTRAQLHDARLREKGVGDGCYRFAFAVDPDSLGSTHSAEVRLPNGGELLGRPISIVAERDAAPTDTSSVSWGGGLRLIGWLNEDPGASLQEVRAFIDGVCVARTNAAHWTHVGQGRDAIAVRGFELRLPSAFADGRVRQARISSTPPAGRSVEVRANFSPSGTGSANFSGRARRSSPRRYVAGYSTRFFLNHCLLPLSQNGPTPMVWRHRPRAKRANMRSRSSGASEAAVGDFSQPRSANRDRLGRRGLRRRRQSNLFRQPKPVDISDRRGAGLRHRRIQPIRDRVSPECAQSPGRMFRLVSSRRTRLLRRHDRGR